MKNKIAYGILIIALLIIYIWTNSLATLWLFIFVAGSLIPAVLIPLVCSKKVEVEFGIINEFADNTAIQLKVKNNSGFPISRLNVSFECENVVFAIRNHLDIDLSVGRKAERSYDMPIKSKYCGQIRVEINKVYVYDYFGIARKMVKQSKGCKFYQYPNEDVITLDDIDGSLVSDSALEYKHVKGNDVSEILQIKDYVRGDSIKSIHWKMSAKMGKLMVKELDTPNDNSIMVFFDYAPADKKDLNQKLIETVASISHDFIRNAVGHTVYRMNTKINRVYKRPVFENSEYDAMLIDLLKTEAVSSDYHVADYILEENTMDKFAKAIYVTYKDNSELAEEVGYEDKCLVYYVD